MKRAAARPLFLNGVLMENILDLLGEGWYIGGKINFGLAGGPRSGSFGGDLTERQMVRWTSARRVVHHEIGNWLAS